MLRRQNVTTLLLGNVETLAPPGFVAESVECHYDCTTETIYVKFQYAATGAEFWERY